MKKKTVPIMCVPETISEELVYIKNLINNRCGLPIITFRTRKEVELFKEIFEQILDVEYLPEYIDFVCRKKIVPRWVDFTLLLSDFEQSSGMIRLEKQDEQREYVINRLSRVWNMSKEEVLKTWGNELSLWVKNPNK